MSLDWLTFKASLNEFGNVSVKYIDDESNEIPIDSECEFQEALRLAKEKEYEKGHLQLILTVNDSVPTKHVTVSPDGNKKKSVTSVKGSDKTKLKSKYYNIKIKESNCLCKYGTPPEWFTNYMTKFKEDLISELKVKIDETIQGIEKDKKPIDVPKIRDASSDEKNSVLSNEKSEKFEENSGKDQLLEQKEVESPTSFRLMKLARLDFQLKLSDDSRTRETSCKQDTIDSYEKNRKPGAETTVQDPVELSSSKPKKSASIVCDTTFIRVRPENKFTIKVDIENNGKVAWEAPRLEVRSPEVLFVDHSSLELFKLLPSERCNVTLDVKLESKIKSEEMNVYFVDLVVMDGPEYLAGSFCVAEMDSIETNQMLSSVIRQPLTNGQDLIDLRRSTILKSRKKIDENIIEIEKRLHDINLLRAFIDLDFLGKETNENERFLSKEKISVEESKELEDDYSWHEVTHHVIQVPNV